jgi:protein-arginine kinase activator protein McsA
MRFTAERCEICQKREAALFMVVRQAKVAGGDRVAKAHVCCTCFELAEARDVAMVEAVSLQEFREVRETWNLGGRGEPE